MYETFILQPIPHDVQTEIWTRVVYGDLLLQMKLAWPLWENHLICRENFKCLWELWCLHQSSHLFSNGSDTTSILMSVKASIYIFLSLFVYHVGPQKTISYPIQCSIFFYCFYSLVCYIQDGEKVFEMKL